jgi:cytochrome c biogenesis protein CcdA
MASAVLRRTGLAGRIIMKDKNLQIQQRLPEDEEDRQTQREINERVKKWGRATCYLGLALVISAGSWSFFFPGQALHRLWETWGRALAVISLCIFLPWLYASATTFNLWMYGANLRKIDRDFASGKAGKWGK